MCCRKTCAENIYLCSEHITFRLSVVRNCNSISEHSPSIWNEFPIVRFPKFSENQLLLLGWNKNVLFYFHLSDSIGMCVVSYVKMHTTTEPLRMKISNFWHELKVVPSQRFKWMGDFPFLFSAIQLTTPDSDYFHKFHIYSYSEERITANKQRRKRNSIEIRPKWSIGIRTQFFYCAINIADLILILYIFDTASGRYSTD